MQQKSEEKRVVSTLFKGYKIFGRLDGLRLLGLLGKDEVGEVPGLYLTSAWVLIDRQPEEPIIMVEAPAFIAPVLALLGEHFRDVSVTLEMTLPGSKLLLRDFEGVVDSSVAAVNTSLSAISGVMSKKPLTMCLYEIEVDKAHYAMLASTGFDEDRLHDLLLGGETDWAQYFNSTWYPMASGATKHEAWKNVTAKVQTVPLKDLDKYIEVLTEHGNFIYDNFGYPLPETLDEAFADLK